MCVVCCVVRVCVFCYVCLLSCVSFSLKTAILVNVGLGVGLCAFVWFFFLLLLCVFLFVCVFPFSFCLVFLFCVCAFWFVPFSFLIAPSLSLVCGFVLSSVVLCVFFFACFGLGLF